MDNRHDARCGGRRLSAVAIHLRSVWPDSTAKQVARVLGCTHRQARRILSDDRIPGRFERKLIDALDRDYERARREMEARHDEIRGYRLALMGRRISARAHAMARAAESQAQRLDHGAAASTADLTPRRR